MARVRGKKRGTLERMEAELFVEGLVLSRTTEPEIAKKVQKKCAIGYDGARKLILKVLKNIQETIARHAPYRRAQAIAGLDRLYERACASGQLNIALGVQKLLAKIEGHEKPQRVIVSAPVETEDEEFEGRTIEDLDYYAQHAHWPEDAPGSEAKGEPEPVFPLRH